MSDRHIIGKREDGFIIYEEGLFAGLMDNEGNVVISTERHYRSIGNFNNGVAIVYHYDRKPDEGGWGLVDEQGDEVCECKYWYIKLLAGTLYQVQVTPGGKENLMWNNGKLIFEESYGSLFGYRHGYIIACNTIRKTKTTPTRYLHGLLHVRGEVLLPVEYDRIGWMKDCDNILYTARDGYIGYVKALYGEHIGIELDVQMPNLWFGVKGTICDGCIYSRGIDFEGKGCGRLFTKSFRQRNLKGRCEYRKTKLNEPSMAERRAKERWQTILRLEDPFREPRQIVKDFITEHLDGDINSLINYDFSQLMGMKRYGDTQGYACYHNTNLVRAIATITFDDIASKEVMFDKKRGTLILQPSALITDTIWGNQVGDWFFMPAFFHCKDLRALGQRIIPCAALCKTIGNLYLQPNYLTGYRHSTIVGRFLIDHMLHDLHDTLVNNKGSKSMNSTVNGSKSFFEPYHGAKGWDLLVKRWMIEDVLIDYYGFPEPITDELTINKYTPQSVYLKVLEQSMSLCYELIPNRSKRMVERLKEKL